MRRHVIVSGLIVFAIASGCAMEGRADAGPPATGPAPVSKETGKQLWHDSTGQHAVQVSVPGQTSLAPLVKQLKPAVVNISSTTVMKNPHRGLHRGPGGPGGDDEEQQMFERFFGQREMPEELKGTSLGSGFIINEDGYILTNNHVVKDATDIKVRLADGRELGAKVVGRDAASDVALLKLLEMKGKLPTVALGDSDALEQGDYVVAIGSPLGFRESVTFGIISAKDRSLTGGPFDDFLQTDAAINQGNSGGPLFNIKGEVVGINTAIISPQIGSGIGFAVPINMAKQIVPQLLAGKVTRGYLGVSVNGKAVDSPSSLTRSVASVQPGGKVSLSLLRGSEKKDIQVTVAQRPDEEAIARGESAPGEEEQGDDAGVAKKGANDKLGIRISALTPQIAQQLGTQADQGVLVVAVSPDGPAGSAGIRKNDVILEVNRQPVSKVEQVVGTIQKMKAGQVVVLRVARGQTAMYLPVKLGGEKTEKK